jgi:cobalamin biosynthesis Mg chelatase CobN
MGCCSPEYRKVVEAQEQKVNQNTNDRVPVVGKIVGVAIVIGAIIAFVLL